MNARNPLLLRPILHVLVKNENGAPYALRIDIRRVAVMLVAAMMGGFVLFVGTLLFFREMEISRKLVEQVLEYETREKLAQVATPAASATAGAGTPELANEEGKGAAAPAAGNARITDLSAECTDQNCTARVAMTTTAPVQATGQLLFVLETEVPRIGSSNPSTEMRKRFFIYPGNITRDELDPATLPSIAGKPYRFSRALQTTAAFNVGKLLRPLAINAYVFDNDKNLIQHERRVIEEEETTP